uniref:Uncharacterized protein n=1 Tax=Anopheles albimanus TaxID=7167 RepID=A0A182FY25_ANOAL
MAVRKHPLPPNN